MTTRSNRPVPTAVVCGTSGGAGTTTVAVPLAVLTQAGHVGSHGVLVDFDSGVFDVLGQPPLQAAGMGRGASKPYRRRLWGELRCH